MVTNYSKLRLEYSLNKQDLWNIYIYQRHLGVEQGDIYQRHLGVEQGDIYQRHLGVEQGDIYQRHLGVEQGDIYHGFCRVKMMNNVTKKLAVRIISQDGVHNGNGYLEYYQLYKMSTNDVISNK